MTGPLLLGAGFGLGLTALAAWVVPARPSLAAAVAALHPAPSDTTTGPLTLPGDHTPGWLARLGRPAVPLLARVGLPRAAATDLAVCGRDPARHLAEQAGTAIAGFLTPPALAGLLALAGAGAGGQTPIWACLVAGALGLWLPDLTLANRATARRRELRDATAGMLDLAVISLAGGAGIEQALRDATDDTTGGWAPQALRQAVEAAHLTRRPPWHTLADLGQTTGVAALCELATALRLAGSEGARIKTSLAARAAALSTHQLAEAETAAMSATEKMVLPMVGLLGGFLTFIGYPAFAVVWQTL